MNDVTRPLLALLAGVGVALALLAPVVAGGVRPVPARQVATSGARLDATSDAEARRMRRVLIILAGQTAAGARCDPQGRRDRFVSCAVPALRRASMGGPMAANVLDAVIPGIPVGRCQTYLLGLQAATQAAGEQAHWLLPRMYGLGHVREAATQLAQITRSLRRAAAAERADVCRGRQTRRLASDRRARLRRHGRPLHSAVAAAVGGGPHAQ